MPSLHVGWSVLVALAAIRISRSRWRWLTVLHPVVTVVSVTVTANHWWLDGVAAAIILGAAILVRRAAAAALMRVRLRRVVDEATRTVQDARPADIVDDDPQPTVAVIAATVPLA
jgi:MFS superfamily sulfate permease-like transporter